MHIFNVKFSDLIQSATRAELLLIFSPQRGFARPFSGRPVRGPAGVVIKHLTPAVGCGHFTTLRKPGLIHLVIYVQKLLTFPKIFG